MRSSIRLFFVLGCWGPACGAEGEDTGGGGYPDADADADGDYGGDSDIDADSDADADADIPPEVEVEADFRTPQAGRRYVYVADTSRDTVAVIDSRSLAIEIVEVGDAPFVLASIPGREAALVLYETMAQVGILETVNGETTISRLDVQPGANRIEVAPDGRHAVVLFDPARAVDPGASEGSYQDVTIIRVTDDPASIRLTVGFHPTDVLFADGGEQAFIVTEDGLHRIVLDEVSEPGVAPTLDIGPAPDDPSTREVVVAPGGEFALVRQPDLAAVSVVDVSARRRTEVALSSVPTDLDVSDDGSVAIAVLRDESTVAILPLPDVADDPESIRVIPIEGELFGQAVHAAGSSRLVLFTTAVPQESLVVLDLDSEDYYPVRLRKTVRTVGIAPGGLTAIVIHDKLPGDPRTAADLDERIDREYGYSLVDLDSLFVRLQTTPTNPEPFFLWEDGSHAFLALRDDFAGVRAVEAVDLGAFQVNTVHLPSPPFALGGVADTNQAFVAQEHKSGRITFIDIDSLATQTVTGFELGAEVME
ncbi:MAG: hypothetical protein HYY06_15915 [Deltaproteobacteria bacterium]|nr:hypothetical protein [Deltaproteobacteria bacterium]